MSEPALCQFMAWDTDFFGFRIARLNNPIYNETEYQRFLYDCESNQYRLVYYFVPAENLPANEFARTKKLLLVDIKTIFLIRLKPEDVYPIDSNIQEYQSLIPDDELYSLNLEAGIYSRFKTDMNFNHNEYERLYKKWIEQSTNKSIADKVFIYEFNGIKQGLISVGKKNNRGDIGLVSVAAYARGSGIGSKLVQASLAWFMKNQLSEVQVITQKNNEAACKLYIKNGFAIDKQICIYHVWNKNL